MKMTTRNASYRLGGGFEPSRPARAWDAPGVLLLGVFGLYARIDQWFLRRRREREERERRWAAQEQAFIDASNRDVRGRR